jgi:hypothetical protein
MKAILKLAAMLAVFLFLSALPAKADSSSDTMTYTLSGPATATFAISMGTAPDFSAPGYAFTMDPLYLTVDGTSMTDTIVFFNSSDLGGLNSVFSYLPDLIGPQLYIGSESDPTLLAGVFQLQDMDTGDWYTLTACETSVPEPSTILMLVSGLFVVGLGFKRRSSNPTDVN